MVGRAPSGNVRGLVHALAGISLLFVAVGLLAGPAVGWVLGMVAAALGITALILAQRASRLVQVAIDPARDLATLVTSDGGKVELPLTSIDRFDPEERIVHSRNSSATRPVWRVVVHKRDGGRLDTELVAATDGEGARAACETLTAAHAAALGDGVDVPPPDPVEALKSIPHLEVRVEGGATGSYREGPGRESLEVAWNAQDPWMQTASAVGFLGGLALVLWSFAAAPEAETAVVVGAWFVSAVLAAAVVMTGLSVGVRVHVRIDDEALTVERRRFRQSISTKRWPIEDVSAIDFSVASSTRTLVVRVVGDAPMPEIDPTLSPMAFAAAVAKHAARMNQLPLGGLGLADGLQLDLALSEAIARRRNLAPGTV